MTTRFVSTSEKKIKIGIVVSLVGSDLFRNNFDRIRTYLRKISDQRLNI